MMQIDQKGFLESHALPIDAGRNSFLSFLNLNAWYTSYSVISTLNVFVTIRFPDFTAKTNRTISPKTTEFKLPPEGIGNEN